MIDDLEDLGLIEALNGLRCLVVIHQNDPAFPQGDDVPAADHAAVLAVLIEDGEIPVAHLGHDAGDIGHRRDQRELHDVIPGHVVGDGGALADQLAGGIGVAGCRHNGDAHLFGNAPDGVAHFGSVAEDEQRGLLLNGAELALVAVGQDDDVALFHRAFQHLRGGSADLDPAGGADRVLVADHHGAAQRLEDVLITGLADGQNTGIEHVHVGRGDVFHRDDALEVVVGAGDGQRVDLLVAHDLPRLAQAGAARDAGHLAVIHIADLRVDVGTHPGRRDAELFQDKFGLLIHLAGTPRFADQIAGLIFQLRIGNGRADRVGVGIAMSDDNDFVCCFGHNFSPLWALIYLLALGCRFPFALRSRSCTAAAETLGLCFSL